MSFFILSNQPSPPDPHDPSIETVFPLFPRNSESTPPGQPGPPGTSVITQTCVQQMAFINNPTPDVLQPPFGPDHAFATLRFYLVRVDPNNKDVYAICSQFFGNQAWLILAPNRPWAPLRWWAGSCPFGDAPHPAKWQILGGGGGFYGELDQCIMFNPLYQKFLCADFNSLTMSFGEMNIDNTKFRFMWRTSSGPVIPTPPGEVTTPKAQYYILSKYGTALTYSTTSPYLTAAPFTYASNQRFFFRAVQTPNLFQAPKPYSYNMYMADHPDTMFCIEDNGAIGIRTAAGPWEELLISLSQDQEFWGGFKISSYPFSILKLRAKGDGSVDTHQGWETNETFFSFMCVEGGTPFVPISP